MKDAPNWSFLITAGGSGSRLGGVPKQFRMLGGAPVWRWSFAAADKLRRMGRVRDIVMTVPRESFAALAGEAEKLGLTLVEGGRSRSESVTKGLRACRGPHVLVHDGARPFISEGLCLRLMDAVEAEGFGAAPLLPSTDSLKVVEEGRITGVADRSLYFRTQTPQAFPLRELIEVMENSPDGGTDEASLWLAAGKKIVPVEGEEMNFKITSQFDWETACALARGGAEVERRTGHGYDIHQLAERFQRRLISGPFITGQEIRCFPRMDHIIFRQAAYGIFIFLRCVIQVAVHRPQKLVQVMSVLVLPPDVEAERKDQDEEQCGSQVNEDEPLIQFSHGFAPGSFWPCFLMLKYASFLSGSE